MLEKDVEAKLVECVKAKRGMAYKFVSPARRNVPDRLILMPIPEEYRELVARYVRFVECKRPGGKPTDGQVREHNRLRAMGFQVEIVDTKEGAFEFAYRMANWLEVAV